MLKVVDYYFAPHSPWAFLGHQRLMDMIFAHQAAVNLKPVDFGKIFPISGGLPLAKRAPQRQAYRLIELKRWSAHLKIKLNLHPKGFPVNPDLACQVIIAAGGDKSAIAPGLTYDLMKAVWQEDRQIDDVDTIRAILRAKGLPADGILARAQAPETKAAYEALTQEAIDRGVFGAPTYVYKDELFWGQDRLDFLDRALSAN